MELTEGETILEAAGGRAWVGNAAALDRTAAARCAAAEAAALLMRELGLDNFEGRSGRGFHHHACLAALAYGFRFFPGGAVESPTVGAVAV